MLPYILAAVGGYLIGDSLKGKQYAEGGIMAKGGKTKSKKFEYQVMFYDSEGGLIDSEYYVGDPSDEEVIEIAKGLNAKKGKLYRDKYEDGQYTEEIAEYDFTDEYAEEGMTEKGGVIPVSYKEIEKGIYEVKFSDNEIVLVDFSLDDFANQRMLTFYLQSIQYGIDYFSVDIDTEDGEQIRDLKYKSYQSAKKVYDKYKKSMQYKDSSIDDIQLIVVYKNGDYDSIGGEGKQFAEGGMMALIEDDLMHSGLNIHIPMLSFSKNDYDVNVNPENLQVDVNIKERDSVDYSGLSETGSDLQQLEWGYAIYPKNVDELYKVLKVLRVSVSYDRLKKYLAAISRYLIGLPPEGIMEKGGMMAKGGRVYTDEEIYEMIHEEKPPKGFSLSKEDYTIAVQSGMMYDSDKDGWVTMKTWNESPYGDDDEQYAEGGMMGSGETYFKQQAELKGGIDYFSVDIDTEDGEQIRDLKYKSYQSAKKVYDKYKKFMQYKGSSIDDIQLIVVYKNGDYDSIGGESIQYGIDYFSVDIDTEDGEQIRDLKYKSYQSAKKVYDKYKKSMQYKGSSIDDIQLIVVYKNGDYDSIGGEGKQFAEGGIMAKGGKTKKFPKSKGVYFKLSPEELNRLHESKKFKAESESIREHYINSYPTDELGSEINPKATFDGLYKVLEKGKDAYAYIGVDDSLVRERVFEKLADLKSVDYEVIYKMWLFN